MELAWADFKTFATARSLSIQYAPIGANIHMRLIDGGFILECVIPSDVEHADTIDFNTNFKPNGNKRQSQLDSEGAVMSRGKTTRTGWHYEPRSLDFVTSVFGSIYNRRHNGAGFYDGTDYGDATLHFFDSTNAELVKGSTETAADYQIRLDANAIKTHVDWQSVVEIDIIGATVSVLSPPIGTNHAWAWIIVAPDIPAIYGGCVPFMAGGWNLRFFDKDSKTFIDGRGVKAFPPDFVYNSNKMRVVIKHELGARIECQFVVEKFNA